MPRNYDVANLVGQCKISSFLTKMFFDPYSGPSATAFYVQAKTVDFNRKCFFLDYGERLGQVFDVERNCKPPLLRETEGDALFTGIEASR